jgi:hypothetical protein
MLVIPSTPRQSYRVHMINNANRLRTMLIRGVLGAVCLGSVLSAHSTGGAAPETTWRSDPVWNDGKAEWALYDAQRTIYGKPRAYQASIFTNKQIMDPRTTTKAAAADLPDGVEVFKHNVSEMIETDNYVYRFLTTCFVRVEDLRPFKIVCSSQEDCGSTYRQFTADDGRITARQFGYFPGEGSAMASFAVTDNLMFHDALTLTLRDYPFAQAAPGDRQELALVQDLTDNRWVRLTPASALLEFVDTVLITVPFGEVETYHVRVLHKPVQGTSESHYYFATDPQLRRVLVQYIGPFGVTYKLRRLERWAYWSDPKPQ